ncbi:hypothetical protein YPPY56_1881, partial [Yersinia pestis PY-56]
MLNGGG